MTNRHTPQTPAPAAVTPGPIADALAALVDLAASDDRDDAASIVRIVRPIDPADRSDLVVALILAAPVAASMAPVILSAPTGPDPADAVDAAILAAIEHVGALVGSARIAVDGFTPDSDALAGALLAAVTRAIPTDASADAIADAIAPRPRSGSGRTRRNVSRDWGAASGRYRTPGSPTLGTEPGTITVRVSAGVPTFVTSDGAEFPNATAAMCHEDGWTAAGRRGGWGSPFEVLRRIGGARDGDTLGAITAA